MNFFSTVISFFSDLYGLICDFFQCGIDLFNDFSHWLTTTFTDLLTLFSDWFCPIADDLISSFCDLVPDLSSFFSRHSTLSQSLYLAYQFFALRECVLIFFALVEFVFTFIVVKFIIKLIPTVG